MTRLRIPSPFDPHVHLRDMEWAHKGSVASETAAALAGGYCGVLDMPNTPPATVNPDALAHKQARFRAAARCDWGLWFGAAQPGNQDCFTTVQHEVCGLKIYNNETTGDLLIEDQALRRQPVRCVARWQADCRACRGADRCRHSGTGATLSPLRPLLPRQ